MWYADRLSHHCSRRVTAGQELSLLVTEGVTGSFPEKARRLKHDYKVKYWCWQALVLLRWRGSVIALAPLISILGTFCYVTKQRGVPSSYITGYTNQLSTWCALYYTVLLKVLLKPTCTLQCTSSMEVKCCTCTLYLCLQSGGQLFKVR